MKIDNYHNLTGEQLAYVAKKFLDLPNLKFALTKQKLGDAYIPSQNVMLISEEVCKTASLASLTIVSHEFGHALQHKQNNVLFYITMLLGKITRITNRFITPLLIVGTALFAFQYPALESGYTILIIAGCLFLAHVFHKIITIPLEYDASRKALKFLKENNLLSSKELKRAKKLLGIAAQTYIAGLLDNIFIFNIKRKK